MPRKADKVTDIMTKKNMEFIFFGVFFTGLFLFFSYVHPLVPYDGDDWRYLSEFRHAWPEWGSWNPSKVLPETVMPLCGYVSAYVFRSLLGDYILAITVCSALIVSIMIGIYLYSFYKLIDKRLEIPFTESLLITSLFLLFHFIFFSSNANNNTYLFYSLNLTCYFFYVLPWLINAILVLYVLKYDNFLTEVEITKSGILFLAFYLAVFSNIFHSVMLTAIIFVQLFICYLKECNDNICNFECIKKFVLKYSGWFIVIAIWLVSLLFEANGGRSHQIGQSLFTLPVKETVLVLGKLLKETSKTVLVMLLVVLCAAGALYWKSKGKDVADGIFHAIVVKCTSCLLLILVYVILVSAKADAGYIGNAHVAVSFLFYLLLAFCFSIAYIFQKHPRIMSLLPCICFIFIVYAFNSHRHFRESNISNIAPYKCVFVDKDLIRQITEADKEGKTEMVLLVPRGDQKDNWPHPLYMGSNLSRTLYTHGLISKNIKITIQPDVKMNLKYRLGN